MLAMAAVRANAEKRDRSHFGAARRILLVAEAVTLAHVARPFALARILEALGHEVVLACSPAAQRWMALEGRDFQPIWSLSSSDFLRALARGGPVYDLQTLRRYVADDLGLIERIQPDAVIGDFRLSLYVSARLLACPYGALANAYWSPRHFQVAQVPEIPLVRVLGVRGADLAFRTTHRLAFRWHALAFVRLCRAFGVEAPPSGLLGAYTASDCTAFADAQEFYGVQRGVPDHSVFLGPLAWSPPVPMPPATELLGRQRPLIYVSLGSSGPTGLLGRILEALAGLPVDVVAATAGAAPPELLDGNATIVDYAPGAQMCERAAVTVCNGGSLAAYQSLAAGTPVIGLASNFDQFLNMRMVEGTGAGRCLRAAQARPQLIRQAVQAALSDAGFTSAAQRAQRILARYDTPTRVREWLVGLGI